jgi:hypothetical protein
VNADVPAEIPKENFWCRAFDKTYIQKYDITPISSGGKYLWYYGKKKSVAKEVTPATAPPLDNEGSNAPPRSLLAVAAPPVAPAAAYNYRSII